MTAALLHRRLLCALLVAGAVLATRWHIAGVYSDNAQVVAMAALLMLATAAYQIADAVQTLCVFVLRCYRVTVAPLLIYCTLLWGLGLGGSYLLAYRGLGPFEAMQSPMAFWLMSAGALWLTAFLFTALLWRVVRNFR